MTNTLPKKTLEKSYNPQEWRKGYESQPQEYNYWIDDIEGEIPQQLQGTLFRNGPGLLEIGGVALKHPFDGDGMVCAVSFLPDGRVHFRNRFVRTQGYVSEQAAGKMLYRGVFGTAKPGGWLNNLFDLNIKNIANTNVIYWGDKLLALWEAAEPYRLNPATLETIGIDYLDGILQPGNAFGAHPWIETHSELNARQSCLVNFSIKSGISSKITIFEFASNGKLLHRHAHSIPGFSFMHDFAITPNYCLFLQNPMIFNPLPYLLGLRGAGECIQFQPQQPSRLIVIPRTPPYQKVKILEIQAGFVFHHANAFEDGNLIHLDSIAYNSLPQVQPEVSYQEVDFEALDSGQLWRLTLNLSDNSLKTQLLESRCVEFPAIHPDKVGRDYRYLFIGAAHHPTGNAPLQAILKIDWQSGERQLHSFAPHGYVSEPIFVPKPDATAEDDGWVLVMVYDASHHRSDVVILDAQDLTQKPLARLHLLHHIPYGLHGSWTEQCFKL